MRKRDILWMASPWSPPAFMKENGKLIEGSMLKKEYYRLYAAYIVKFIEAYAEGRHRHFHFYTPDEAAFCNVLYDTLREKDRM